MVNKRVCAILILLERVKEKLAYFSYFSGNELISRGFHVTFSAQGSIIERNLIILIFELLLYVGISQQAYLGIERFYLECRKEIRKD